MSRETSTSPSELQSESSDPETVLAATLDTLKPHVRMYAENLQYQIQQLFTRYQATTYSDFRFRALSEHNRIPHDALATLHQLLAELSRVIHSQEVPEGQYRFTLRDPENPYWQVYAQNGVRELHETTDFDLGAILESDRHKFDNAGLPLWKHALPQSIRSCSISEEAFKALVRELREGAILIFMPMAHMLTVTLREAIARLKPLWIEDEVERKVNDTNCSNYLEELIQIHSPLLVKGIPSDPYLLLVQPEFTPPRRLSGLNIDSMRELANQQHSQNPYRFPISLPEYLAMQYIFSRRVQDHFGYELRHPLTTLNTIDRQTFTAFIDLPLSKGGNVPNAGWDAANSRLHLGGQAAGVGLQQNGFRTVVRIPLFYRLW